MTEALKDNPGARYTIRRVLVATYGRQIDDPDKMQALWKYVKDEPAEIVVAAIDAHITDDSVDDRGRLAGQYPPTPAQLRARIRQMKDLEAMNQRTQAEAVRQRVEEKKASSGRRKPLVVPDAIAERYPILRKFAETWTSDCPECSDRGIASFYVETDANARAVPGRVYLRSEAATVPDAVYNKLRRESAVCDCAAGRVRPEANYRCRVWHAEIGAEVEVCTFPKISYIRKIAKRRQDATPDAMAAAAGPDPRPVGNRSRRDAASEADAVGAGRDERGRDWMGVTGNPRAGASGEKPRDGGTRGVSAPVTSITTPEHAEEVV